MNKFSQKNGRSSRNRPKYFCLTAINVRLGYIFLFGSIVSLTEYSSESNGRKKWAKNKRRRRVRAAPAPHLEARCISLCGADADQWPTQEGSQRAAIASQAQGTLTICTVLFLVICMSDIRIVRVTSEQERWQLYLCNENYSRQQTIGKTDSGLNY